MPSATAAVIPRARASTSTSTSTNTQRNEDAEDAEDLSRAVIMRGRGPKVPITSTSSKAIVLRHGRHGIWGEGKLATFSKLSGQEKLALKAGTFATQTPVPPADNTANAQQRKSPEMR